MSRRAEPGPLPRGKQQLILSTVFWKELVAPSPPLPRFFRFGAGERASEGGVALVALTVLLKLFFFCGRARGRPIRRARGARVQPGPVLAPWRLAWRAGVVAAGACECGKSGAR
jgi:hypothetical protein